MSDGDGCGLECVKVDTKVHEFVGPIRIILVDDPNRGVFNKSCGSSCIMFAFFLMGSTVVSVVLYALSFLSKFGTNMHLILCTVGYQVMVPVGILNLNAMNFPVSVLKPSDRKIEHTISEIIGLVCVCGGAFFLFAGDLEKALKEFKTPHGISGVLSTLFALLSLALGPSGFWIKRHESKAYIITMLHGVTGVACYGLSSFCFITGLYKKPMFVWFAPVPELIPILVFFCILYTLIIIAFPLMKYFSGYS